MNHQNIGGFYYGFTHIIAEFHVIVILQIVIPEPSGRRVDHGTWSQNWTTWRATTELENQNM